MSASYALFAVRALTGPVSKSRSLEATVSSLSVLLVRLSFLRFLLLSLAADTSSDRASLPLFSMSRSRYSVGDRSACDSSCRRRSFRQTCLRVNAPDRGTSSLVFSVSMLLTLLCFVAFVP